MVSTSAVCSLSAGFSTSSIASPVPMECGHHEGTAPHRRPKPMSLPGRASTLGIRPTAVPHREAFVGAGRDSDQRRIPPQPRPQRFEVSLLGGPISQSLSGIIVMFGRVFGS